MFAKKTGRRGGGGAAGGGGELEIKSGKEKSAFPGYSCDGVAAAWTTSILLRYTKGVHRTTDRNHLSIRIHDWCGAYNNIQKRPN